MKTWFLAALLFLVKLQCNFFCCWKFPLKLVKKGDEMLWFFMFSSIKIRKPTAPEIKLLLIRYVIIWKLWIYSYIVHTYLLTFLVQFESLNDNAKDKKLSINETNHGASPLSEVVSESGIKLWWLFKSNHSSNATPGTWT